jgi:MFS family permease
LLGRPGAARALLAAASSFGVMVAAMSLIGHAMTGMGHHGNAVFPVLSAHFLGMFAFMIPVGIAVDRVGHTRGMIAGLVVLGASVCSLVALESAGAIGLALFGVGLGWNVAFVGATTRLAALTDASERGTLFGVNDFVSGLSAAVLSLAGGALLTRIGLPGLGLVLTAIVVVAASAVAIGARRSRSSTSPE